MALLSQKSTQIKNQLFQTAQISVLRCSQNQKSAQRMVLRSSKTNKKKKENCSVESAQLQPQPKEVLSSLCSAAPNLKKSRQRHAEVATEANKYLD